MSAETTTGLNDGKGSPLATEPLIWEDFLMENCPGPAATWPCALLFGHGGDHERFLPEATESEVLAGVRRLRESHDELLTAVKNAYRLMQNQGQGSYAATAILCAAIAKAELR